MANDVNNILGDGEKDLFVCPDCRKKKMFRVKRTRFERIVAAISFGNAANKKFYCTNCNRYILTAAVK